MPARSRPTLIALTLVVSVAVACGACGLQVASPDLFVLQRTGTGRPLRLLVNDGGTIRCNAGQPRALSDPLLIDARQLASDLDQDARSKLTVKSPPGSVHRFTITLANGTIAFPDTAGRAHPELARAELFAVQAAQQACPGAA